MGKLDQSPMSSEHAMTTTPPSAITDQELSDSIYRFASALVAELIHLKRAVDAECERLNESRRPSDPYPREPDIGLSCIESAAHDAEFFAMEGLAVAVQKSISERDSTSLEIWAEHEAERRAKAREKREASQAYRQRNDFAICEVSTQP
ncbi:MAG: hypothetical protein BGP10_01480 [Rhodanobacter sp. 68-29]|nr:MAG: hypothetical protein ABT17_04830 [Rhodanobacter sp. SCN 69-32]OJY59634.1 MAG: hypothetical protein BGP10_01480 [Rhodanobacter sp. 68-29]